MRIEKCVNSDKENTEKYILINDNKQIGYGYIIDREINPIEIYINEKERSNGYGKLIFEKLFQDLKERGKKVLTFDLRRDQYRMANIIASYGALQIETLENSIKWVLPLQN